MKNAIKIGGISIIVLMLFFLCICPILDINISTPNLKGEYVDRVDRVPGYYVAVYNTGIGGTINDEGKPELSSASMELLYDCDWKHEEMDGIVVYKRFLCFSKNAEKPDLYYVVNEAENELIGRMYVLRGPSDEITYYFSRWVDVSHFRNDDGTPKMAYSSVSLSSEYIEFSYNGEKIELQDCSHFMSKVDFSTGTEKLYVNGEAFHLATWEQLN